MTTVYITKYALPDGILSGELQQSLRADNGYVAVLGLWASFRLGRDAFMSLDEARIAADKLRLKQIASARKQIARLDELSFHDAQAKAKA